MVEVMVAEKVGRMEEEVMKVAVLSADLEDMVAKKAVTEVKTTYTPFHKEDAHNNIGL